MSQNDERAAIAESARRLANIALLGAPVPLLLQEVSLLVGAIAELSAGGAVPTAGQDDAKIRLLADGG